MSVPRLDASVWSQPTSPTDRGSVLVTYLPLLACEVLDPHNATSGGSVTVPVDSDAYRSGQLTYGNVVRVADDGRVVASFEVSQVGYDWAEGDDEAMIRVVVLTGDGPEDWLRSALVLHRSGSVTPVQPYRPPGTAVPTPSTRAFDFSSYDYPATLPVVNPWQNMSTQYLAGPVNFDPANPATGDSPSRGPGYKLTPSSWPKNGATQWVCGQPWQSTSPFMNTSFGAWYWRSTFAVPDDGPWELSFAADNAGAAYIDGELIAESTTSQQTTTSTMYLQAGVVHRLVVRVVNYQSLVPFNPSLVAVMIGRKRADDTYNPIVLTSGAGGDLQQLIPHPGPTQSLVDSQGNVVYTRDGSAQPPQWTLGDVVRSLQTEAQARGVHGVQNMAPTFDGFADSSGESWGQSNLSYRFDTYSTTLQDVIDVVTELGADWAVDPDTFALSLWKWRGRDLRSTVQLGPATPIQSDGGGRADPITVAYLRTGDRVKQVMASRRGYGLGRREAVVSQSGGDTVMVNSQVARFLRAHRAPEDRPLYRYSDPGVGAQPWVDFTNGDVIRVYDVDTGQVVDRRVVSIAAGIGGSSDGDSGYYDVELDAPDTTALAALNARLDAVTGSGSVSVSGVRASTSSSDSPSADQFGYTDTTSQYFLTVQIPAGGRFDVDVAADRAVQALCVVVLADQIDASPTLLLRLYGSAEQRARDVDSTGQPRAWNAPIMVPDVDVVFEAPLTIRVTTVYGGLQYAVVQIPTGVIDWASAAVPPVGLMPFRILNMRAQQVTYRGIEVQYRACGV